MTRQISIIDYIFDDGNRIRTTSSREASKTPFEDPREVNDGRGTDRSAVMRERIMVWISKLVPSYPDGLGDDDAYNLPMPKAQLIETDELEFPLLPVAPKTASPLRQVPINYLTLNFTKLQNCHSSRLQTVL
jgi:hypothetical protein